MKNTLTRLMEKSNCYEKLFRKGRRLRQHCQITNCQTNSNKEPAEPKPPNKPENIIEIFTDKWGEYTNKQFEENVSFTNENILYWKKNIFLLPTGKSGECFIDETVRLTDAWVRGSPLNNIAFKAFMIMPSILLQKPSKDSKTKEHTKALEINYGLMDIWLNS